MQVPFYCAQVSTVPSIVSFHYLIVKVQLKVPKCALQHFLSTYILFHCTETRLPYKPGQTVAFGIEYFEDESTPKPCKWTKKLGPSGNEGLALFDEQYRLSIACVVENIVLTIQSWV